MTNALHARACKLALSARIEELAPAERDWLEAHLSACAACREYAGRVDRVLGSVRSMAPTAGDALVRRTQLRVRQRAAELCGRDAMMRPLWLASAMVVFTSLLLTPLLWQAFAWIGRMTQLPNLAWHAGFLLFWVAPALAASALLLASGFSVSRWQDAQTSIGREA